ncbi:MAG TPA: acyl-CoA carboxylase subunit epsilon [Jatrophihabitans sp.]|nr:acyl-CoA carboxylase subunit epsilon [Jatrophihabitans sp.]
MNSASTPTLQIVHGSPTAEELALLTAVVAAAAGGGGAGRTPPARRGGWNDPTHRHRRQLLPGPNGWRASARPV